MVQIHMFPAQGAKEAKDLLDLIPNLPIPELAKIIKFGKDGNWSYFVTEPLPEGQNIREWIGRAARSSSPSPNSVQPVAPGGATEAPKERVQPRAGQPRPLSVGDSLPGTKQTPGSFTQVYRQDGLHDSENRASVSPEDMLSPGGSVGSFTKIYKKSDWTPPKPILTEPSPPQPTAVPDASRQKAAPGLDTFIGLKPTAPMSAPADAPSESRSPPNSPSDFRESSVSFDYLSRETESGHALAGPHISIRASGSEPGTPAAASITNMLTIRGPIIDLKIFLLSAVLLLAIFLSMVVAVERSA